MKEFSCVFGVRERNLGVGGVLTAGSDVWVIELTAKVSITNLLKEKPRLAG